MKNEKPKLVRSLPDPRDDAKQQTGVAMDEATRMHTQFLHFPWAAVDALTDGIGQGELWFVGAYSGHGKTTFLMSALDAWFEQGVRVFYMGLESQPHILRTQWACRRLGIDAGEVLSGKASERADWKFVRAQIVAELKKQVSVAEQIYFAPEQFVDAKVLERCAYHAHELESDVFIIDHVDHLEGVGRGLFDQSVYAIKRLLSLTQEYGLRTLAATQFNNDMIRGNRLGMYTPPQPTAVYMGNHKRQVADGMLGLYRPLRFSPPLEANEIREFSQGFMEPRKILEPNVMAVNVMKHRKYGSREGQKAYLRVEHGKVLDLPDRDLPPGVRTRGMT